MQCDWVSTIFVISEVNQREDPRHEWQATQQKMLENYLGLAMSEVQVNENLCFGDLLHSTLVSVIKNQLVLLIFHPLLF